MNRVWVIMLAAVVVLFGGAAVRAQDGGGSSDATGSAAPSKSSAALPTGVGTGEVQLKVTTLGVGGKVRAGDWAGVQVELQDSASKPRDVMLRLSLPDADGDTAWIQRVVTSNPGSRQRTWLYARLPSGFNDGVIRVSGYEATPIGDDQPGRPRSYRAGKLIGGTTYVVNQDLRSGRTFIGLVGTSTGGMEQYGWPSVRNPDVAITGHEVTDVVSGLTVNDLPERWFGLAAFESLVWTGNDPQLHQPGQLRQGQPEAIKEWVRRGGHLVIVLPAVGQTWYEPGGAETGLFADILPKVKIKRQEGVALEGYRSLLTRDRRAPLPTNVVVQTFEAETDAAAAAGPFDAMPIMAGPNGEVVVVRRLVGSGAVTLIGLDLTNSKLRDNAAALQADHFWHRVLGKRMALPTPAKLDEDMKGGPKGQGMQSWSISRTDAVFDSSISRLIAKSGSAAAGVLLGLAVFAAYWLVAGPLGFFALKRRGQIQHAWVAFAGAIALFTAVAWGGANALKIRRVEGQHLTIVDGVYGQTTQRARSFVSLFLPRYGEQRVSCASGDDQVFNGLSPWEPPPEAGGAGFSAFPDARGYAINSRAPDTIEFPSRATVKQVQVDWLGALPVQWGMPSPSAASTVSVGGEIRLVPREEPVTIVSDRTGPGRRWAVDGTLTHTLPGRLTDVHVVLVRGQGSIPQEAGLLQSDAYIVTLPEWPAGTPQQIDKWFDRPLAAMSAEKALQELLGRPGAFGGIVGGDEPTVDPNRRLIGVSLFSMLKTPTRVDSTSDERGGMFRARRQSTHGYDLSRWFTQPCVMVMGVLDDSELPVPLSVDSMTPEAVRARVKGKTLVRWVFPMSPQAFKADPDRGASTDQAPDPSQPDPSKNNDKLPGE